MAAGVAAQRSERELGHAGLAATRGHRTPAALVQAIAGGTKAEADRHVRLGTALLEGSADPLRPDEASPMGVRRVWHEALRSAHLAGGLTASQYDAIYRGLGEPPPDPCDGPGAMAEAWSLAAEQLMREADAMPAEELQRRARQVRDALDPAGAVERFARRYERRAFRMWTDADGARHASIAFDDEMAAWVQGAIDAALRPRRGGPRFVDPDAVADADELVRDLRTNDQLTYDLMMDVWRAGALAEASQVFGARQPGVRILVVEDLLGARDPLGRLLATGHAEDRGDALPGPVIDRSLCSIGSVRVTVDSFGNPLDVGREQRLYTPRQRTALAVRDGGCMFPGCTVPASYCEAHHCDHWWEHLGRTDIDRGILLCRFHHMLLHNRGWRIARDGLRPFVLHPPPGEGSPVELRSKSPLKWAWDPPPPPDRPSWRTPPEAVHPSDSGRVGPGTSDSPETGVTETGSAHRRIAALRH
nr:HNH endonuclease signature motif containing protein [Microbacterium sp. 4R-513]